MFAGIKKCSVCGKAHESVQLHPVNNPGLTTHWYSCPETGEPRFVAIHVRDDVASEFPDEVVDKLAQAVSDGRYTICVFRLDGTTMHLYRKPQAWPSSKKSQEEMVKLLAKNLGEETAPPPQTGLKQVKAPGPPVKLFGDIEQ